MATIPTDFQWTPEQKRAIDRIRGWAQGTEQGLTLSLSGAAGTGKCLGLGTPVMRFDGSVTPVEELRVGDLLMGPDSRARRVLSLAKGAGPLRRVVPVKGSPWICNDVHILTLAGSNHNKGKVVDVSVNSLERDSNGRVDRNWKLFIPDGVDFSETDDSPVDPYFMGVWFGDGTKEISNLGLAGVSVCKPDLEISEICEEVARQWGLSVNVVDEDRCPRYTITGIKGMANPLTVAMRSMLGETLAIPRCIRTGSRDTRLKFLAGICDSDGSLSCGGFEIVQKRNDWADDILFIARSLGFWASDGVKEFTESNIVVFSYQATLV